MKALLQVARSFRYAGLGFRAAFASQMNFRIQCGLGVVAVGLGFLLGLSAGEWLWLLLCIALVLAAELLNTALEILVDLVSPGFHVQAGKVKDIAAAAVTILAVNAAIGGAIIFLPKLWNLAVR